MTGIEQRGRTATVLLRGSNKLALAEAERSLHDALCVVRCLVQVRVLSDVGCWLWRPGPACTAELCPLLLLP